MSRLVQISRVFAVMFLSVFSVLVSHAEPPKTPEYRDYAHLVNRSPFVIKKQEVAIEAVPVQDQNWYLRGVTKFDTGWLVVLVDRKKPKESVLLRQGEKHVSGLELIGVMQNKEDYTKTLVKLRAGSRQFTVGYNPVELKNATKTPVEPTKNNNATKKTEQGKPEQKKP